MTGSARLQSDPAAHGRYLFDNDNPESGGQHQALSRLLDPFTFERLDSTGVRPGWHCLEVGAGGGSVATWLAERVCPGGRVLATDIKPGWIPPAQGLEVVQHDVVTDPLPEAAFDLVHARLVLSHLPERERVVEKLAGALRPGGWLQIDEIDISYWPILLAPDDISRELFETYQSTMALLLQRRGSDPTWGSRVAQVMSDTGLASVDPVCRSETWAAGSPGLDLLISNSLQLRDGFVSAGMDDGQLDSVRAVMADPRFLATSFAMYSVLGQKR
jgi:SAM-dependent methyltransferase